MSDPPGLPASLLTPAHIANELAHSAELLATRPTTTPDDPALVRGILDLLRRPTGEIPEQLDAIRLRCAEDPTAFHEALIQSAGRLTALEVDLNALARVTQTILDALKARKAQYAVLQGAIEEQAVFACEAAASPIVETAAGTIAMREAGGVRSLRLAEGLTEKQAMTEWDEAQLARLAQFVPASYAPNNRAIRQAIEDGEAVPGYELAPRKVLVTLSPATVALVARERRESQLDDAPCA